MGTQGLILSGAEGLPFTGNGGLGVFSQLLILYCQAINDLREKRMKRQENCFHLLQKEKCMIFSGPALHLISNNFPDWRVNVKVAGKDDFQHMLGKKKSMGSLDSWAQPVRRSRVFWFSRTSCVLMFLIIPSRILSNIKRPHPWAHALQLGMHSLLATVFVALQTCGDIRRQGFRLACRLQNWMIWSNQAALLWMQKLPQWINVLYFSLYCLCTNASFTSSGRIQVGRCLVLTESMFC